MSIKVKETITQKAICPSCGQEADFKYIGEQKWPPEIAEMQNIPASIRLWLCGNCCSTISELNMQFSEAE